MDLEDVKKDIDRYFEATQKSNYYMHLKMELFNKLQEELLEYFNQDGEKYSNVQISDVGDGIVIKINRKEKI